MSISQKKVKQLYDELKIELKICKIGGLFLALYKDKDLPENIINNMRRELTDQFLFTINMDERKVPFSTFFGQSFEQIGKQSNIFHVIGIEKLSTSFLIDFIRYLQYGRERFKSKPYSIVFWLTPQLEKQLFHLAPDFHHWIFGTYDFTQIDSKIFKSLKPIDLTEESLDISLGNIEEYLIKVVWQYEHWQEVKDGDEEFLIEVMGRANLHDYYVQSYCVDKDGEERLLDDVLDDFMNDENKNFLTLLGDFGTGKSSFSLHYYIYLAKKYLKDKNGRIPIFISLKNYPGRLNIEDFIVEEFYDKYNIKLTFSIFQNLALQGKFVFFVDGFDEMASLVDKESTMKNFKELAKLSFENVLFITERQDKPKRANKVFLTCRTHYFLSEIQEKEILKADYTVLYRNYATKSNYEITRIRLKEFNDKQIQEYILKNTRNEDKTEEILKIIKNTYNLKELSTRPLLLEMILKTLPTLLDETRINAANLYKAYTDIWIEREDWRSQMTPEGKRAFMWQLSLKMFTEKGDYSSHYSKLERPKKEHLKKHFNVKGDDYYKYETTTCTFLNRDQAGNYKFIHKSFMEYFLAECFFVFLKKNRRVIEQSNFNNEIIFFLKYIFSLNKKNLQNLNLSRLSLTKFDLEEANLSGSDLSEADLREANLVNANLEKSNLTKANLRKAHLENANLYSANLNGTDLHNANLNKINLHSANLENADLYCADLRNSNLVNANFCKSNLINADLQGADLDHADFKDAYLWNVDLRGANLHGLDFRNANVHNMKN